MIFDLSLRYPLLFQVTGKQFLASEAWSTSEDLLHEPAVSELLAGVLGVAIQSSPIPGFENYLRSLHPARRPFDHFIGQLWQREFKCNADSAFSGAEPLLQTASLPPCSGAESLKEAQNPFTDTSELRVVHNVYLAVYAAAHGLHSLLSCPHRESDPGKNDTCILPKHIHAKEVNAAVVFVSHFKYIERKLGNTNGCRLQLLQRLSKVTVTTPQGDAFYFEGADIEAKYDLVNWQRSPEGTLRLVLVGGVDGFDLRLNESAMQWSTGSSQVVQSEAHKTQRQARRV